ncbi:MAG: hypothetical protein C4323_20825, partial [Mastigocladus sp. ERB_26_2]
MEFCVLEVLLSIGNVKAFRDLRESKLYHICSISTDILELLGNKIRMGQGFPISLPNLRCIQ